jgi:hypothetical protein
MNEEKSFTWHHFRHDKRELICDHLNFTHCCYKVRKYKSTTQDDYKAASDYYNKKTIMILVVEMKLMMMI